MFSRANRTALLAGLLVWALAVPAVSADVDTVKAKAIQSDQPLVMGASSISQPSVGPVVARESLSMAQVEVVGGAEQNRSAAGVTAVKRMRAARAARAAGYSSYGNGNGYRSSAPIILGVRF